MFDVRDLPPVPTYRQGQKRKGAGDVAALKIKAVTVHAETEVTHLMPEDERFPPIRVTGEFVAQSGATAGGYIIAESPLRFVDGETFEATHKPVEES